MINKTKKIILLAEKKYGRWFLFSLLRNIFYLSRDIYNILSFLYLILLCPIVRFYMIFFCERKKCIVISLRDSYIGPCSLELIFRVKGSFDGKLILAVKSIEDFNQFNRSLLAEIDADDLIVVKQESFLSMYYVLNCSSHVAFENVYDTFFAAVSGGNNRKSILVPDGVVTKTNGNLCPSNKSLSPGYGVKIKLI